MTGGNVMDARLAFPWDGLGVAVSEAQSRCMFRATQLGRIDIVGVGHGGCTSSAASSTPGPCSGRGMLSGSLPDTLAGSFSLPQAAWDVSPRRYAQNHPTLYPHHDRAIAGPAHAPHARPSIAVCGLLELGPSPRGSIASLAPRYARALRLASSLRSLLTRTELRAGKGPCRPRGKSLHLASNLRAAKPTSIAACERAEARGGAGVNAPA